MDMQEFKDEKRRIMLKWGASLFAPTPKQLAAQRKDVAPLCKFAKMRPEKLLNGMASAWLRGEV